MSQKWSAGSMIEVVKVTFANKIVFQFRPSYSWKDEIKILCTTSCKQTNININIENALKIHKFCEICVCINHKKKEHNNNKIIRGLWQWLKRLYCSLTLKLFSSIVIWRYLIVFRTIWNKMNEFWSLLIDSEIPLFLFEINTHIKFAEFMNF